MTLALMLATASFLAAVPIVPSDAVSVSQDAETAVVSVSYKLTGAPGIITVDIQTNAGGNAWASIGGERQWRWTGDVSKLVDVGTRKATWAAGVDFPNFRFESSSCRAVVTAWATNAPPDYMVASLSVRSNLAFYAAKEFVPFGITDRRYKTECLAMRRIHAANVVWTKGAPPSEYYAAAYEKPQSVMLTKDYYIGVYEVTKRQLSVVGGGIIGTFNASPDYLLQPVESTAPSAIRGSNWTYGAPEAVGATSHLGRFRSRTGLLVDLPTDAQWEFACRAGCPRAYYNNEDVSSAGGAPNLTKIAWYTLNNAEDPALADLPSKSQPHEVGLKEPNAWGLYDMLGNVQEFALDWRAKSYSSVAGTVVDPYGPTEPCTDGGDSYAGHLWCGGAYNKSAGDTRVGSRYSWGKNGSAGEVGFRMIAPAEVTFFNREVK